ncbi:MAG: replicative DNA helicase [Bdellovibrionaceae bacterium]|nr:replicative DNA helicase [Pseudobdellovibrionaceae bacterium]
MNKTLPHNIEAEQAILGGLMLDSELWDELTGLIDTTDFYRPAHKKIFEAIKSLYRKGQTADIVVLSNHLQQINEMDAVGGTKYLAELIERTTSTAYIEQYAKIVREKALVRKMIAASQKITEEGLTESYEDVEKYLESSEADIFNVAQTGTAKKGLTGPSELVQLSIKKIEEMMSLKGNVTGVPTGFIELDDMTAGFHGGELIIVAARPSMGKTALGLNLVAHAALREKKSVAFFSVEMPQEQLMMRILASEAKINLNKIRIGQIDDKSWGRLISTAAQLSESKLFINDTSNISPFEIRSIARKQKSKHGLDMIMIDYLQLMSMNQKMESREREVAEISKSLKALAKELNIPVVALAQINRGVEGRSDRRPMLSDLRESGSIEQDADVIMMIYRDDYYERENPTGLAEIIIGKQRNGPVGTVKLRWEPSLGRFSNNIDDRTGPNAPFPTEPPVSSPSFGPDDGFPPPSNPRKNFAPGS